MRDEVSSKNRFLSTTNILVLSDKQTRPCEEAKHLEEDLVNFKSCKNELSSIKQVQILHEGRQKMLETRITFLTDNLKLYRKCVCD